MQSSDSLLCSVKWSWVTWRVFGGQADQEKTLARQEMGGPAQSCGLLWVWASQVCGAAREAREERRPLPVLAI